MTVVEVPFSLFTAAFWRGVLFYSEWREGTTMSSELHEVCGVFGVWNTEGTNVAEDI